MAASLDPDLYRVGLPATPFAAPAEAGCASLALVASAPLSAPEGKRSRWVIPALLVAGWGGLFVYCATYLREDLPFRPQTAEAEVGRPVEPRRTFVLPEPESEPVRDATQTAALPAKPLPATASPPAPVAAPPRPIPASADYVGVWGPTPAACGSPSRRRGYLPATITADRARAGRTVCAFHDGRRTGNAWIMAADCSDRGRHWSSQVRLTVEGDRMTWSSSRGSAAYIRCNRRPG